MTFDPSCLTASSMTGVSFVRDGKSGTCRLFFTAGGIAMTAVFRKTRLHLCYPKVRVTNAAKLRHHSRPVFSSGESRFGKIPYAGGASLQKADLRSLTMEKAREIVAEAFDFSFGEPAQNRLNLLQDFGQYLAWKSGSEFLSFSLWGQVTIETESGSFRKDYSGVRPDAGGCLFYRIREAMELLVRPANGRTTLVAIDELNCMTDDRKFDFRSGHDAMNTLVRFRDELGISLSEIEQLAVIMRETRLQWEADDALSKSQSLVLVSFNDAS